MQNKGLKSLILFLMIYGTQDFAQLLKELIRDGKRHDLYHLAVNHARDMSVHINGDKPIYLLERARPREDEETKLYRLENYEPTTKAGADKAIKIVSKGFNPSLFTIQWKEKSKQSEEIEQYTMEYYPNYNSILNFNKDVVLRKMLADPNGVVAVKPEDIPDDDTEKAKPIVVVYGSCALWWVDKDCFLLCVSDPEQSEHNDHEKVIEARFEYYDKTQYIDFTAIYDASDKSVELIVNEIYKHGKNKIPAWYLGGESKNLDNGKILYQSYFSAALPHWNKATSHESDLMASIIAHMFPQKYEVADECAYSEMHEGLNLTCRAGKLIYPGSKKGEFIKSDCPQCHGTGLVSVKGPLQTYQFLKEKLMEGTGLGITPVGYIQVPIDATKFLDDYTEKCNQKAMWAINMDIEEKIGENQSGVAKTIDRSAQNDTIFDIISRIFDVHLNNEYFYIDMYMNDVEAEATGKKNKNLPEINKPTKFELLTTAERVNNFEVAKRAGLDKNILRTKAIDIINSENGSTPDMKNYLTSLIDLDPLYGFTVDEIDLGVTKGVVRKVDWAIHDNIKTFIDRAIEEDKDFLNKLRSEKIEVLETFGNELIEAEKPRIDEAIMLPSFDQNEAA